MKSIDELTLSGILDLNTKTASVLSGVLDLQGEIKKTNSFLSLVVSSTGQILSGISLIPPAISQSNTYLQYLAEQPTKPLFYEIGAKLLTLPKSIRFNPETSWILSGSISIWVAESKTRVKSM